MFTSDWPLICFAKNLLSRERARVRHLKEVVVAAERHYIRGQTSISNRGLRHRIQDTAVSSHHPVSSSQHTWTGCAFSSRHRSGVVLRQRRLLARAPTYTIRLIDADRGFYPTFETVLVFSAVTGHHGTSLKTTTTSPTFAIVVKHLVRPLSHHNGEIARVPAEGEYGYAYWLDGIKCQSFATI
jgi:hypothetical protein